MATDTQHGCYQADTCVLDPACPNHPTCMLVPNERATFAAELIDWLNECVDCGRAHEERVDSNGYTTTRSQVDGHPYTARAQLPTFDIFDLVREWADLP